MTRPTPVPFELLVDVAVAFRRSDDARPVNHRLGELRLSYDDRYDWRLRLAELFDGCALELRNAHENLQRGHDDSQEDD